MKILITGSNGLLGQKLIDLYKNNSEYELIATARGDNRYSDKNGYTYESLDITNAEEVAQIIAKHQPEVVINTASDLLEASKLLSLGPDTKIDFSEVTGIDTSTISLIFEWKRRALKENQSIKFVNLPANLNSLTQLYGVNEMIN